MAAEVSRQIKGDGNRGDPITRDFLGGSFGIESKELDLDLQVPVGWEKRLDLKSGKVYIQKCIQQSSPSDHKPKIPTNQTLPTSKKLGLKVPPYLSTTSKSKTTLNLFEDTIMNNNPLPKLPLNLLGNYNSATYQSVCTLDKVKSALDRAWRVPSPTDSSSSKKRPFPSRSPSLNEDFSSCEQRDNPSTSFGNGNGSGNLVAGACPSCLSYVLITKSNPKCPKCNSAIPLPTMSKKPKIDLNISI